jgi:hypothetical protein
MKRSEQILHIVVYVVISLILILSHSSWAQRPQSREVRWLRVGALHSTFAIEGAETEMHRTGQTNEQCDGLRWPADIRYQDNIAAKSLWIGTTDYKDPVSGESYKYKVIAAGTRTTNILNEIMPVEFKMIGRFQSPKVYVDGLTATDQAVNDVLDEENPDLVPDRLIYHKLHTSLGITVTRKLMAFAQENHDNYYIYEYVFKNTGIIDLKNTKLERTLTGCIFHFQYRYAFAKEASLRRYLPGDNIRWGKNCVNQVVGINPLDQNFEFRAQYSWFGHHSQSTVDDWGCPNYNSGGALGAPHYVGTVTLHADKSAQDNSDDPYQPKTTMYLASDGPVQLNNQYDPIQMTLKYQYMSMGHPAKTHADEVGDGFADLWTGDAGGIAQGQGFGPYDLAYGDSVRIILAEGVKGLSRAKSLEVGDNWFKNNGPFTLPDGSTTTDRDLYKKQWVLTGVDSLFLTFRRALANYASGYKIPVPPPPPDRFEVKSGGDRISLEWSNNAASAPHFNGYRLYRAEQRPDTLYTKLFECDAANLVTSYTDTTPAPRVKYYYYIQSKDDGSQNDVFPGRPLCSSRFYTMTNTGAMLLRPAGKSLSDIRVVPNPYHIRARNIQYGDISGADQISFVGLPPVCTIKIYTERGDLVDTLDHTNTSGDEVWYSLTSSDQIIVSGLYIAVIESPKGEKAFVKFVIIR